MAERVGKYLQTSSNNFDELLKHIGIPDDLVAKIGSQTNSLEISKSGDIFTIKSITGDNIREHKFELGKPYTESFPGGRTAQALVVGKAPNRLIHTLGKGEKQIKTVYEFNGNELRVTATSGPVVAVRTYAKQ